MVKLLKKDVEQIERKLRANAPSPETIVAIELLKKWQLEPLSKTVEVQALIDSLIDEFEGE